MSRMPKPNAEAEEKLTCVGTISQVSREPTYNPTPTSFDIDTSEEGTEGITID